MAAGVQVMADYWELLAEAGFGAVDSWKATSELLQPRREAWPELWAEFTGGWNAVAYRYLGVRRVSEELRAALGKKGGDAPPPTDRAQQEHDLFVWLTTGLSALESCAYAAFALGAMLRPLSFSLADDSDKRKVGLSRLRDSLRVEFPTDPLIEELEGLLGEPVLAWWKETRNTLTHRASPGRIIDSRDRSAFWMGESLSASMIRNREGWLEARLALLVRKTEGFTRANF